MIAIFRGSLDRDPWNAELRLYSKANAALSKFRENCTRKTRAESMHTISNFSRRIGGHGDMAQLQTMRFSVEEIKSPRKDQFNKILGKVDP